MAAAVTAGGVLVVNARAAEARQPGAGPGLGAGQMAQRLGLTREQRIQIRTVLAADRDKITGLLSAMHDARMNLRATIRKPGTSENEIRGAAAKMAAMQSDLAVERAALYGKISPILTAEQLARLEQLQQRADDRVDGAIEGFGRRLAE
jgi:Spy/CpxP family protein refolding chaperone